MEPTRRNFHHPYQPYQIQYELMNAIYDCIADRKVGIFESPTGTVLASFFAEKQLLISGAQAQ